MSDLRLYLLAFGAIAIVAIYVWGSLKDRKEQRQQTVHEPLARHDIPDVKMETKEASEIDYASALDGLTRSLAQTRETETLPPGIPSTDEPHGIGDGTSPADLLAEPAGGPDPQFAGTETEKDNAKELSAPEKIIMLHIIPRGKDRLEGGKILQALDELKMAYGEMQIFHHYGVGQMKMDKPLFSLANMVEPGNFDINTMEQMNTPGLVMFQCLPSPIDPQVIFELMLNTAQRLAEILAADVCDDSRKLIDESKLNSIRLSLT